MQKLLAALDPGFGVEGPTDIQIDKIECDSRRIGPGDMFVAIRGGEEQDRHLFVPDALARGAAAVVVEERVPTGKATRIQVGNCRRALALMAARYYGHADRELTTVGITGTKGKTTTAFLVQQMLEAAGRPCGYVGTLGCIVDDRLDKSLRNTTPEAVDLHRLFRAMRAAGKRAAALEVSSHALALERVAGVQFAVGIFTNLSRDHLNFHQTTENYFAAKARLFRQSDRAVVNADDAAGQTLLGRLEIPVFSFGRSPQAQVRLLEVWNTGAGMGLRLETPAGEQLVESRLTGGFNCHNILAAFACGLSLELAPEAIARGIAALGQVPGRFERIDLGQDFAVIVDYAHTPASLETVLHAARELTRNRLICVFGCGGDRDRGKRPLMGGIAGELADLVYITSDNPRSEAPEQIIAEIAAGLGRPDKAQLIADRRQAIERALAAGLAGDVVVIAGKGHEAVQIFVDRTIEFDDRQVAREVLQGLLGSAAAARLRRG
ncbi:MAG: UDP-N-acetylmuramoyl-L-alanyl-D-glutamate--2,6-diaminopimelate ligase [Candidatus Latescibacteria bacterium]|nr:UDP-N-acetylmuramoyl-L-alanyl-D-glutamate--2,6-diaminopimelate ligase [Candidatus Latescibacterota bacterium]